jgi:para-nitrobenzyl esterase
VFAGRARPADTHARKLPVMEWIYGGGFVGGSTASPGTSGVPFARQGVVLVSFNYRVGRFGFFAFPALSAERPGETRFSISDPMARQAPARILAKPAST